MPLPQALLVSSNGDEKLSLPSRYLSNLLRQETGKTALEHIHIAMVLEAKNLLTSTYKTVAETA